MKLRKAIFSLLVILAGIALWSVSCVSVRVVVGDENDASREDEMRGVSTETNKEPVVEPDSTQLWP